MTFRSTLCCAPIAAVAGLAHGQASFTYNDVTSDVPGDTFNETLGDFTVQSLTWSGIDIVNNGSGSFLNELLIGWGSPSNGVIQVTAGADTGWDGMRNVSGWSTAHAGTNAAGEWSFNFTESFDDDGVDAIYGSVTVNVNDTIFPDATNVGAGTVMSPIEKGGLQYYLYDHAGGFASFSTLGSTLTDNGGGFADDDTELAIYDLAGNLIAENDDEDFGNDILTSHIEFEDLAAGQYALVVGAFETVFDNGLAVTGHDAQGEIVLTVVPAPAAWRVVGAEPTSEPTPRARASARAHFRRTPRPRLRIPSQPCPPPSAGS